MVTIKKFLLLVVPWQIVAAQDIWMVIWVHGTSGAVSNASLSNVYKIMTDEVEGTEYAKAVDLIRTNHYTYQTQPIGPYGLHKIEHSQRAPGDAAALCSHIHQCMQQDACKQEFDNRYYTFGWSGVLSESIRYENAVRFYRELLDERKKLEAENPGKNIKICIIGYSHGGTVALQLAHVYEKNELEPLTIDRLISLGAPIQKETDHLAASLLFKKIYHIYSRSDAVQPLDFFSFKRFFSYRRFNDDSRFVMPAKVVQIELKLKTERRNYKEHEKRKYMDRSPGHIELWFFGWTEGFYRKDFPLYPLPTSCLVPALIKAAETGMPQESDLVIELCPSTQKCIVKKRGYFKKVETKGVNFKQLQEMQEIARNERPMGFNREMNKSHIRTAVNQAYQAIPHKHKKHNCACGS